MILRISIGLLLFTLIGTVQGQFGTGILLDEEALEKIPTKPDFGRKGKLDTLLKVDLTPYCPKVGNQGLSSTCTGWAIGYGAMTIHRAIQQDWRGQRDKITENAFSALYIYNQIKTGPACKEGTYITKGLELIREKGNTLFSTFETSDCDAKPGPEEVKQAAPFRVSDFRRLYAKGETHERKLSQIKSSLAAGKPVVICLLLKEGFLKLQGREWYFPNMDPTGLASLAHAMVVVGYDDTRGREGAFQVMNSWGTRWGEDGFIWIGYSDFTQYCPFAFEFSTNWESMAEAIDFQANVRCRFPQFDALGNLLLHRDGSIRYKNLPPTLKEGIYYLDNRDWSVEDMYQFAVGDLSREGFLYLFSMDASGKINVHWPRDEQLDDKFEGVHESEVIYPFLDFEVPGTDQVLQLEQAGQEWVCFLFSQTVIPNFNERIQSLKNSKGSLPARVREVFKEVLADPNQIVLQEETVGFSLPFGNAGTVPLYLTMNVSESGK